MLHFIEKITLVAVIILLLLLGVRLFLVDFSGVPMEWGVTFDRNYAAYLGLEPKAVLQAALADLGVDHLRLTIPWKDVEGRRDVYDWSAIDWQLQEARKYNAKVILTLGRKLPRWPECYQPDWYNSLPAAQQRTELLQMVSQSVERYQRYDNIIAWQVENEPLVGWFGDCPPPNREELKAEVALVKSLDSRPIVVTDSGELGLWLGAAKAADILGTTLYRVVWNDTTGFFHWPLPPAYYYYKAALVKHFTGVSQVMVTELQAEPWSSGGMTTYPLTEQYRSMDIDQFSANLDYARRAGFDTAYLWGLEWWYWMKQTQGVESYWQTAKKLWGK
ncbi:hypothetical protein HY933_01330 [Candidatus Falkowbacteria bacterium]|nr:hypothetical protein [Candidatus Falkowbacteria bacterium]